MDTFELNAWDRVRLWVYNRFGPGEINLYFIRHGESEGNVDPEAYLRVPDHAIELTGRGVQQADDAGDFLGDHLYKCYIENPRKFGHVRFLHSPYVRSRQTTYGLLVKTGQKFKADLSRVSYRELDLLFEQQAGRYNGLTPETFAKLHPIDAAHYNKIKSFGGKFYAPVALGESQADTITRARWSMRSLVDDYRNRKRGLRSVGGIRNYVISSHGVTMNTLVMAWMKYPPEWAACEWTPKNCSIRHIHGSRFTGYIDEGYIYGEGMPLHSPTATQNEFTPERPIFMLKPQHQHIITPRGVKLHDPFEGLHK